MTINNSKKFLRIIYSLLIKISPVLASKVIYYKNFRRKLDLKNPTYFNDKLMWLKLNEDNSLKTKCADKYLVRDYINQMGYSNLLVEIYKVYDSVEEINFEELPNSFVMKCTHGCGFNIICPNKGKLDIEDTIRKVKKWMKTDYGLHMAELHYSKIKPRIIIERFLGDSVNGKVPSDYMIHCFHGEPRVIEVGIDKLTSDKKEILFNCDWEILNYNEASANLKETIVKPERLNEMLDIARSLSSRFTYVRVDLYYCNNRIYFGELTFTPAACLDKDFINNADYQMGQFLDLTVLKKKRISKASLLGQIR